LSLKGERKREKESFEEKEKSEFEEKVKKLLSPFLSSCLFCFSSFGTQPRRLSSNEQKKGKRE